MIPKKQLLSYKFFPIRDKIFPEIQTFILCTLYNELILQGVSKSNATHCKIKGFFNNRFLSGALIRYFGEKEDKDAKKNSVQLTSIVAFTKELSKFTILERFQTWSTIRDFICGGNPLAEREKFALEVIRRRAKSKVKC